MTKHIARFASDESGATAIEYGLIAGGIALVIVASVSSIGTAISAKLTLIATSLK